MCIIWHQRSGAELDQIVLDRSTAVCRAWWNAVNARVHQVRGATGFCPRTAAVLYGTLPILRRWSPNIVCIPTCMRMIRLVSTDWCQPAPKPTCHGASTTCGGGSTNRLQLNALKTEFIWCASARRHHIPDRDLKVGHDSVHTIQSARDPGVYVDGGMTMRAHINQVLSSCYGTLYRSIKWPLASHALNWTLSLPVSYTAGCTATLFLLVYQLATFNVCSPSSTQPYVWSPTHCDVITWLLCCVIATGFLLSSAWSKSSAQLHIIVCTVTHPVCCCKSQSRSEICWVDDHCSATHSVIIWRALFCGGRPTCVEQATVTPPSSAVCWHLQTSS